jgi:hypothetical protein
VNGLASVRAVASGYGHSLALAADGTVWAWGDNTYGQLGDGSGGTGPTSIKVTPVQVSGLANVVGIGAGEQHSLAVKSDGTVWAWGLDGQGELGDWRPDMGGIAVPVNVLDDLNQRGSDAWLDQARQVPLAADTSADVGLSFEGVVARHTALLDAYPALRAAYLNTPGYLTVYGLPLVVKDYGAFVAVRLQRSTLQLWNVSTAWAAAGQVVVGNGADIAKDAGLWPLAALAPLPQGS